MRFQADIGKKNSERERAGEILNSGNDRGLLKLMRDETTLIVLMVRLRNEQRHDEWEARQDELDEEETEMDSPLFGLPKGANEDA